MGFQIKNKEGIAIAINALDKEIADLWGFVPQDKNEYAKENNLDHYKDGVKGEFEYYSQSNWYDTIGWMIHDGKSLQGLIEYYTDVMKEYIGKIDEDGTVITIEKIYPKRMLLLNTWINKGYTAHQVID